MSKSHGIDLSKTNESLTIDKAVKKEKPSQRQGTSDGYMTNRSKMGRIFNPSAGKGLTDKEYQNSSDKYDAQRKRRKN